MCKPQLLQLPRIYRLEDLFSRSSSNGNRLGLSYELLNPSIYHITAPNHSLSAGRNVPLSQKCSSASLLTQQENSKEINFKH